MRGLVLGGAMALLASACSPPEPGNQAPGAANLDEGKMDHLRCAAMIGAADRLIVTGAAPADAAFSKAALVAAMTHLNAYAIPKGIPEQDAFMAVDTERTRILAEMKAADVVAEARSCVANLPAGR